MMESLGDQLKPMKPDADVFQAASKRLEEHNGYKLFRGKYPDIDDHTLLINSNRLLQMCKEFSNCAVCMSLDSCRNDFKGHYYGLQVTNDVDRGWDITEIINPCKKHRPKH